MKIVRFKIFLAHTQFYLHIFFVIWTIHQRDLSYIHLCFHGGERNKRIKANENGKFFLFLFYFSYSLFFVVENFSFPTKTKVWVWATKTNLIDFLCNQTIKYFFQLNILIVSNGIKNAHVDDFTEINLKYLWKWRKKRNWKWPLEAVSREKLKNEILPTPVNTGSILSEELHAKMLMRYSTSLYQH